MKQMSEMYPQLAHKLGRDAPGSLLFATFTSEPLNKDTAWRRWVSQNFCGAWEISETSLSCVFIRGLTWQVNNKYLSFSLFLTRQLKVKMVLSMYYVKRFHRGVFYTVVVHYSSVSVSLNSPPSLRLLTFSLWRWTSHCAADVGRVLRVWVSCVTPWGNPGDFVQDTARIDWQAQRLPESNMAERNLISPPPFTPPFQFHHLLSLSTASLAVPSSPSCSIRQHVQSFTLTTFSALTRNPWWFSHTTRQWGWFGFLKVL